MPHTPRPERRLPAAALILCTLIVLGFSCFVGGITAESRIDELAAPPAGTGAEPPAFRDSGDFLLVCADDAQDFAERNEEVDYNRRIVNERLYEDCLSDGHLDLAAAIDAAEPGTRVRILPGRHVLEAPVVIETADLQIEGLGDGPEDVILSAGFAADTVLDARGATGLHLSNLTLGQARADALRLTGVDGVAVERIATVQSGRYGIHVADSRGVTVADCRTEGADAAGIAVEDSSATVTGCESKHNLAGLLATGAGALDLTGNRLHDNATGIVVSDTAHARIQGNRVHDNNTEPYARLGTDACEADLADRDWSAGALCPARTYPSGVGILLTDSIGAQVTGNRLWNQQTAALATWGTSGPDSGRGDQNRFEANTFGIRDDGQKERNRLDLWWDGLGAGNCFAEPDAARSNPAALPDCDVQPQPSRLLADPLHALKTWHCGIGDTAAGVPSGCDWFGARFTDRLEFQVAVVFAALLLFLTGAGWLAAARSPNPPRAGQMTFSAIATGAGGLLLVVAVWSGRADYEALAIGLWGIGWILAGRSWFRCGVRFLGTFTGIIGILAVLDAVDRGLWTLAPTPVSFAWIWLLLLPLWTLTAIGTAFGPRRGEEDPPAVERTPVTAPHHDRWDW